MRIGSSLAVAAPFLLAASSYAPPAAACGGCFIPPDSNTQVTGHRMALSVSNDSSTLWDQIEYSGEPADFAWVLPTHGLVDIDVSSDLLFATLDYYSGVTVSQPDLGCPYPPSCNSSTYYAATGTSSGSGPGGVEVIAQEVVGPYETVQLLADDPAALKDWLAQHSYAVPESFSPVIDAYVAEGFGFLAMKLIPGRGVDSMRPVRVTSPGSSLSLPLRMVAAGTGALTTITLWILGEGRYAPTAFPTFTIHHEDLVWDWDTSSSNYDALRQAGYDATSGFGWLVEAGEATSASTLESTMLNVAEIVPEQSGYGDGDPAAAVEECQADLAKLLGGIDAQSLWVTRIRAELPQEGLVADLDLGASPDQTTVERSFVPSQTIGTTPECPTYPPCDVSSASAGTGGSSGTSGAGGEPNDAKKTEIDSGCATSGRSRTSALAGLGLAAAIALLVRRRAARDRA